MNSNFEREEKEMNFTSKLTFGKYRGKTIAEIFKQDAQYLLWAIGTTHRIKLSIEDKVKIIKRADTENLRQYK